MKFKLKIILESPLIAGGGGSNWWSVDKTTAFDENGLFIPSTAIKGMLSEAAERFFGKTELVRTLFGEPGRELNKKGVLNFYNAVPATGQKHFVDRFHVSLSRRTRTALRNRLFSVRAAERGLVFECLVTSDRDLSPQELALLKEFEKLPLKLGGMKSSGYGRVKLKLEKIEEDSKRLKIPEGSTNTNVWLLIFKASSPFVIAEDEMGRRKKTYLIRSKDHVPGSTFRGAVAYRYGFNNTQFQEIFESGKLRFPYLYPSSIDERSIPTPLTLLKPKYSDEDKLVDSLAERLEEVLKEGEVVYEYELNKNAGSDESIKFEPAGGYLINGKTYEPSHVLSTHISLSRTLGNARHGQLWIYDAIETNYLAGELIGDPALASKLDLSELHVGVGKSRGFGRLELIKVEPISLNLKKDLEEANEYLRSKKLSLDDSVTLVPLLLTAPFVGNLNDALGAGYDLKLAVANRYIIKGYDMKKESPKPVVSAIAPGSVAVYLTKKSLEEAAEELQRLKIKGIGDPSYTIVGCGNFDVYNPARMEVKENG